MALSKINLQSSEAIASLNEERPLLSRRARPVRLPDIQRSFLSGDPPEIYPKGHKLRISAVYEKNRSARLGEPVFCVLRILWINDVINVFGKEECVQGTHQGFLARSIPARMRHGLLCRPYSAIKKRHASACLSLWRSGWDSNPRYRCRYT